MKSSILTIVTTLFISVSCSVVSVQNDLLVKEQQYWSQLKSATPKRFDDLQGEVDTTWYLTTVENAKTIYWKMCLDENRDQFLKYYISRLGTEDAQSDFMWILGSPDFLFPKYQVDDEYGFKSSKGDVKLLKEIQKVQVTQCKYLVQNMVSNPKFMKRYYDLIRWTGFLGEPKEDAQFSEFVANVEKLDAGFQDADEYSYWSYARYFVLLVHQTSRDDLLKDADPDKLLEKYKVWREWLGGDQWKKNKEVSKLPHFKTSAAGDIMEYQPTWFSISWKIQSLDRPFPEMKYPFEYEALTTYVSRDYYRYVMDEIKKKNKMQIENTKDKN